MPAESMMYKRGIRLLLHFLVVLICVVGQMDCADGKANKAPRYAIITEPTAVAFANPDHESSLITELSRGRIVAYSRVRKGFVRLEYPTKGWIFRSLFVEMPDYSPDSEVIDYPLSIKYEGVSHPGFRRVVVEKDGILIDSYSTTSINALQLFALEFGQGSSRYWSREPWIVADVNSDDTTDFVFNRADDVSSRYTIFLSEPSGKFLRLELIDILARVSELSGVDLAEPDSLEVILDLDKGLVAFATLADGRRYPFRFDSVNKTFIPEYVRP